MSADKASIRRARAVMVETGLKGSELILHCTVSLSMITFDEIYYATTSSEISQHNKSFDRARRWDEIRSIDHYTLT